MNDENYKSCSSCFFSEKFPGIIIEKNDRCNLCNNSDFEVNKREQTYLDITELYCIANELKERRKGKYDCIIGASGGLDSSYVIYVAKRILELNPLVIQYDHGFNHDIAINNLETICSKLEVDLKTIKIAKRYDLKYVRFLVLALRDMDLYWGVCSFCHYVLPTVIRKYALEENISAILSSSNLYEDTLYLKGNFRLKFMLRKLLKLNIIKLIRLVFYMSIARYYLTRLKLEFCVPAIIDNIFRGRAKRLSEIKQINITRYVEWDIDKMVETMEKEIGWKTPNKPKLPMRFDCKIGDSFLNYTYKKATGLTVNGIICNNLIYDRTRIKFELEDTIKQYDNDLIKAMRQMLSDLKVD